MYDYRRDEEHETERVSPMVGLLIATVLGVLSWVCIITGIKWFRSP